MEPIPTPTLDSELPTGLYSEDEKAEILARIESAAGGDRMVDLDEFTPRKQGILFPVMVNVFAVALIVGAWFAADSYFQVRQQNLSVRTNKLFSAESKLLAKVLEESKAQMDAASAEIDKIQGDLQKAAADKADLQKSFEARVSAQDKALRKELSDALDSEKKRLQATGLGEAEVSRRLVDFESQKNNEFNSRLDAYRKQAQSEIDQRSLALSTLQAKLQTTVSETEKLQQEIAKQTKEREGALQSQLTTQSADLEALKKERDDLNAFYRQADASLAAVRAAFESQDLVKSQAAVEGLRQVLTKASASSSEAVRARAQAQTALADSFDAAFTALDGAASKAETTAQIEAVKTQAKKDLAQAVAQATAQLTASQQALAATEEKWKQAVAEAAGLQENLTDLVAQIAGSKGETANARLDSESLGARVADLQQTVTTLEQTVADLTPYKEKTETLTRLFAAAYPTAQDRFKTVFGSEIGAAVFPGFDAAWDELGQQIRDANNAQATRKKALDDVLAFTTYLRGLSSSPTETRDTATKLARTDEDYKKVVESVQALAASGFSESSVNTAKTQLYGTVAAASAAKIVLEPLTKVKPAVGQLIELRRIQNKKETVLGRGAVLTVSTQKVEIDWSGNSTLPLSGDAAYLVLP